MKSVFVIRAWLVFFLVLSGCARDPKTIENTFEFDLSPCWGARDGQDNEARICRRESLSAQVAADGPNACLVLQQDENRQTLPLEFKRNALSVASKKSIDLRVEQKAKIALFFFTQVVDEAICAKLAFDTQCRDSCYVRLTDDLSGVPQGTKAIVDFKVLRDGNLICDYLWGDEEGARFAEVCDGIDNDCDGVVDETSTDSSVTCCNQDADCSSPREICVASQCEVCALEDNKGCPQGIQCLVVNGRPVCDVCREDSDCGTNAVCHMDRCLPCVIGSNRGCSGETPICKAKDSTFECVGCNNDCEEGLKCHMGACVACVKGAGDCPADRPICDDASGVPECRSCKNDQECPNNFLCFDGACEPCTPTDTSRCPGDKPYCSVNEADDSQFICSSCMSSDECEAKDPAKPFCVGGACNDCSPRVSESCPAPSPVCARDEEQGYTCRTCLDNDECAALSGERPVCSQAGDTQGQCVVCSGGNLGACDNSEYCVNQVCSSCEPGTNFGCADSVKPLCAPRVDAPGVYHCTHCDREAARENSGCPANRVCALLREGEDPVCDVCDPVTGAGCIELGMICDQQVDGPDFRCRPCSIDSNDCSEGQHEGRVCRFFNNLSRCLECDPAAELGTSNGCLDMDKPFCVDGSCTACDPATHTGCGDGEGILPICADRNGAIECVGCENDTECVRKNGRYCDEVTGACLECPANPRPGDDVPQGCPQPEPCTDADCAPNRLVCVPQFGDCKACDPFSQIAARYKCDVQSDQPVCRDGLCEACDDDAQCRLHPDSRPYCRNGMCAVCDPMTHEGCQDPTLKKCAADGSVCVQCLDDNDCSEGLTCLVGRNVCGCQTNEQCMAISPDRPVCRFGENRAKECQACTIERNRDGTEVRNDCAAVPDVCGRSVRCQLCLDPKACQTTGDCPAGLSCVESVGQCFEGPACLDNMECLGSRTCNMVTSECDEPALCRTDLDCHPGRNCNQRSGVCEKSPLDEEPRTMDMNPMDPNLGEDPQNGVQGTQQNYGCDETSDSPICVAGACRICRDDADCFARPGGRNVCRNGRCELCQEGGAQQCMIPIQAVANVSGRGHPDAILEVKCHATDETLTLRGNLANGEAVRGGLLCPSGSDLSVCCSDGGPCSVPLNIAASQNQSYIQQLHTLNLQPNHTCPDSADVQPEGTDRVECNGRVGQVEIAILCSWIGAD